MRSKQEIIEDFRHTDETTVLALEPFLEVLLDIRTILDEELRHDP